MNSHSSDGGDACCLNKQMQRRVSGRWIALLVTGYCLLTHRPRPWFRDRVVVCVPLLRLPVDLSVAPAESSLHLRHGERANCWAAWRPFIPVGTPEGTLHLSFATWGKFRFCVHFHTACYPIHPFDSSSTRVQLLSRHFNNFYIKLLIVLIH